MKNRQENKGSAGIIILLISLLIVGFFVIQNWQSLTAGFRKMNGSAPVELNDPSKSTQITPMQIPNEVEQKILEREKLPEIPN